VHDGCENSHAELKTILHSSFSTVQSGHRVHPRSRTESLALKAIRNFVITALGLEEVIAITRRPWDFELFSIDFRQADRASGKKGRAITRVRNRMAEINCSSGRTVLITAPGLGACAKLYRSRILVGASLLRGTTVPRFKSLQIAVGQIHSAGGSTLAAADLVDLSKK
jgi:hypothetical protein